MATSYSTLGGSGYRRQLVTVTTTADIHNGPLSNLVDGNLGTNNNHGCFCSTTTSGVQFKFAFFDAVRMDEFTWTQDAIGTQGTYTLAGSNDDISYTTLATGLNIGGVAVDVHAFTNTNFYKYYKLTQTAGSTNTSRWIEEVTFKIELPAVSGLPSGATAYATTYGQGNRSAAMQALFNQVTACGGNDVGSAQPLVDGSKTSGSCATSTALTAGITNLVLDFQFPTPLVINEFTWFQDVIGTHGAYTLSGSQDGITFTTITTGITLGGATSDVHAFSNSTGYYVYRLTQTSGATSATPWIEEVEFKTATLAALPPALRAYATVMG